VTKPNQKSFARIEKATQNRPIDPCAVSAEVVEAAIRAGEVDRLPSGRIRIINLERFTARAGLIGTGEALRRIGNSGVRSRSYRAFPLHTLVNRLGLGIAPAFAFGGTFFWREADVAAICMKLLEGRVEGPPPSRAAP
jgi:hypothetical protein